MARKGPPAQFRFKRGSGKAKTAGRKKPGSGKKSTAGLPAFLKKKRRKR